MSQTNPPHKKPGNSNNILPYFSQAFIAIVVVVIGFIIADMFFSDKAIIIPVQLFNSAYFQMNNQTDNSNIESSPPLSSTTTYHTQ